MKKNFKVTSTVSDERIRDMLVTAFEGGTHYWATIAGYRHKYGAGPDYYCTVPLDGGALLLEPAGAPDAFDQVVIDRPAIHRGREVMATKYPGHYQDLVSESDDAVTGDVFIQCCAFGEIVYS